MPQKTGQKRTSKPERVGGLRDAKDRREAGEALARAFGDPGSMERHMERSLWKGRVFDPGHTRIVVADGRVVSAVVMGPRHIRFGPVRVPAMTLGPVGTHDHYRKRGYGAEAMRDATRYMKENGILVAYLQGISNFYYRFGYYPFMAPSRATFKRADAKKEALPGRLRAMTRGDLPRVRRIYDAATARRTCAAVRDKTVWDWLFTHGRHTWLFRRPRVVLDERDRVCGYVTMENDRKFTVREIVVKQDEAACRAALGAIVREARRREAAEVRLPLPWDDALAIFLRQHVSAEFTMHASASGGAMLMIGDFPGLARRLEPLFAQRWQEARTRLPAVRFTLASEIGSVGFVVTRDSVRVTEPTGAPCVRVPRRWLSGLLTGYYAPGDIAPRKGARIPGELMPVLDILFPQGWPFVYQGDNY